MPRTAQRIYQDVLNQINDAILSDDFDLLLQHVALPHILVTSTARLVLDTEQELREMFTALVHSIQSLGLTSYRRTAHECNFVGDTVIHGHHTSHFIRDGSMVFPSYPSMCKLELRGGHWMVVEAQNAIENNTWPILVPQVSEAIGTESMDAGQRKLIAQKLLDQVSDAFVNDDAVSWLDCFSLPFTIIGRDGPLRFETEEEAHDGFLDHVQQLKSNGITDVVRTMNHSQMVGPDQMICSFRTYLLRRAEQAVPSWQASAVLRQNNERWRVSTLLRAVGQHNWSDASANDT